MYGTTCVVSFASHVRNPTKCGLLQSKSARGERMVFSVDAQRELWSKAASAGTSGFPGGPDAYVQVRGRISPAARTSASSTSPNL